jgi:hypothetical protein
MNKAQRPPRLPAFTAAICALGLAACAGPTSHYYADGGHGVATYAEVRAAQKPLTWRLDVRFLQDGEDNVDAASLAREDVRRVLDQVGGFTISDDPRADTLSIVIRGTYDPQDRTGEYVLALNILSMQWFSDPILDPLRFEFVLRPANGATRIAGYDHGMLATLASHGHKVDDRGPFSEPAAAFNAIVEDVTLHFLKDIQGSAQSTTPLVYLP